MNPILQRLLDLMSERGLTAKQVTIDCNMSASSFTDWKKGKASPSVESIAKLSDYFHVSTDYLIKGEDFDEHSPVPADNDVDEAADSTPDKDSQPVKCLEFSNPVETELLARFRRLHPEYQGRVISYIDGMLAMLPIAGEREESAKSIG